MVQTSLLAHVSASWFHGPLLELLDMPASASSLPLEAGVSSQALH